jgi:hypothetical protein
MKLPEDGLKHLLKQVAVIKQNQCKQFDCFILKYLLCWRPEYHKTPIHNTKNLDLKQNILFMNLKCINLIFFLTTIYPKKELDLILFQKYKDLKKNVYFKTFGCDELFFSRLIKINLTVRMHFPQLWTSFK